MTLQEKYRFYTELWNLTLESDPTETFTGLIAFGKRGTQSVVLKIVNEAVEDEHTAAVLRSYAGHGAVHLLEEEGNVTLLERAMPGTPLTLLVKEGQDAKATHIFCDILEKLHHNKTVPEGNFTASTGLIRGFEVYLESHEHPLPADLVKDAHTLYRSLTTIQTTPVLLHRDLHHENILYDENRGWLAIDPKGVIGNPLFEVGAFFRNPKKYPEIYCSSRVINKRLDIIHERCGFDKKHVLEWSFAEAVLAGIWSIECDQSPDWAIMAAKALHKWI